MGFIEVSHVYESGGGLTFRCHPAAMPHSAISHSAVHRRHRLLRLFVTGVAAATMVLIPGVALAATAGPTITVRPDLENAGKPVFSPDGSKAYVVGTSSGKIVVIDVASASASPTTFTIPGSTGGAGAGWGLGISPDGTRLYATGFAANTLSILDASTGAAIGSPITVGSRPGALAVSPDGSMVFTGNWVGNSITFVSATSASVLRTVTSAQARDLAVSPDGVYLYAAVSGDELLQITISNGSIVRRIPTGRGPNSVAITPDGAMIIVANSDDDNLTIIRTTDWSTRPLAVGDEPYGVAITPNGRTAYVSNHLGGTISVVDLLSQTVTDVVVASPNPWQSAVSPLGTRLYVGSMSGPRVFTFEIEGGGSGGGGSASAAGSVPRGAMQQFAVPSGTISEQCPAFVPEHVDWLGLQGHRELGWGLSYAEWPNEGRGGFVCVRNVRWTGTTWVIA